MFGELARACIYRDPLCLFQMLKPERWPPRKPSIIIQIVLTIIILIITATKTPIMIRAKKRHRRRPLLRSERATRDN